MKPSEATALRSGGALGGTLLGSQTSLPGDTSSNYMYKNNLYLVWRLLYSRNKLSKHRKSFEGGDKAGVCVFIFIYTYIV